MPLFFDYPEHVHKKKRDCLLLTSYAGFGDLLYQTPLIRFLAKLYRHVDVWSRNPEPFVNNPDIRGLYFLGAYAKPESEYFYGQDTFITVAKLGRFPIMPQSSYHTTDFFTIGAADVALRDHEKDLTLKWNQWHEAKVRKMLEEHGLITNEHEGANFVTIAPAITWKSRTLPLRHYQRVAKGIIANGDKIVLIGKNVNSQQFCPVDPRFPESYKNRADFSTENKHLYPASSFECEVIDFTDKLTLHETAALYSLSKAAINTENGNMVISATNANCWNIYIPTLTAPEFRLPHRNGNMYWRSAVVGNKDNYYPGNDFTLPGDLYAVPVKYPSADDILDVYNQVCKAFKAGENFIHKDHVQ